MRKIIIYLAIIRVVADLNHAPSLLRSLAYCQVVSVYAWRVEPTDESEDESDGLPNGYRREFHRGPEACMYDKLLVHRSFEPAVPAPFQGPKDSRIYQEAHSHTKQERWRSRCLIDIPANAIRRGAQRRGK